LLSLVPKAFAQGPGSLGCAKPTVGVQSPINAVVGSDLYVHSVKLFGGLVALLGSHAG
jgi:hypothetical protein